MWDDVDGKLKALNPPPEPAGPATWVKTTNPSPLIFDAEWQTAYEYDTRYNLTAKTEGRRLGADASRLSRSTGRFRKGRLTLLMVHAGGGSRPPRQGRYNRSPAFQRLSFLKS